MLQKLKLTALLLCVPAAFAQTAAPPFDAWKKAVSGGDPATLSRLYSPQADTQYDKKPLALKDEIAWWAGLKSAGMTEFIPRLLETEKTGASTRFYIRVSIVSGGKLQRNFTNQFWDKQNGSWKIVRSTRDPMIDEPARVLPQPPAPNTSLYPDPKEAESELKTALAKAAKEKKRVIVVFGGNWCYDCHVLDTTFRSKEFAPLVNSNYVVIHINIGDELKDNTDLAARLGVALDKGVPSLGVLDPDGKVVYAQKNGEFESTVTIGPKDVRAFLEKWKPAR